MLVIEQAIAAIGNPSDGEPDYILQPEVHAAALRQRAGSRIAPLVRILERHELQDTIEIYTLNDRLALQAQKKFLLRSQVAVWWFVYVVIVGAVFAVFPPSQWGAPAAWLTHDEAPAAGGILLAGGLVCMALAGLLKDGFVRNTKLRSLRRRLSWLSKGSPAILFQLSMVSAVVGLVLLLYPPHVWQADGMWSSGRFEFVLYGLVFVFLLLGYCATRLFALETWRERWMRHRGRAELARKQLFERVLERAEQQAVDELPVLPLKFEYFRRYQLDVQRDYFARRSKELHGEAAWGRRFGQFLIAISAMLFFLVMLRAYAPLTEQAPSPWFWQIVSALAQHWPETHLAKLALLVVVVCAALIGGWRAQTMINNTARNARRYENTLRNLDELERVGLADARAAAAAGQSEDVLGFVRAVHSLLSAELQEWTVLTKDEALRRIDSATPTTDV